MTAVVGQVADLTPRVVSAVIDRRYTYTCRPDRWSGSPVNARAYKSGILRGSAFASARNGKPFRHSGRPVRRVSRNVAALEQSDNVADRGHAFATLKRGYTRRAVIGPESEMRPPGRSAKIWLHCARGVFGFAETTALAPVNPNMGAVAPFFARLSFLLTCLKPIAR